MSKKGGYSGQVCVVHKCHNSWKKIKNWKESRCNMHPPLLHTDCDCLQPYALHRFPGREKDKDIRRQWIKNVNRKHFQVKKSSVVCNEVFEILFKALKNDLRRSNYDNRFINKHEHRTPSVSNLTLVLCVMPVRRGARAPGGRAGPVREGLLTSAGGRGHQIHR